MSERWKLILLLGAFLLAFFLPIETPRVQGALLEGFFLLKDYAREHVLLCLVPAFFIAGGISVFISQAAVMKYLGAGARKTVAYGVASVSGSILAVCSWRTHWSLRTFTTTQHNSSCNQDSKCSQ